MTWSIFGYNECKHNEILENLRQVLPPPGDYFIGLIWLTKSSYAVKFCK